MASVRLTLGEQSWTIDQDEMDLQDAFLIKSVTGGGLRAFWQGVADMDPTHLQALVWWCRRKAGELVAVDAVQFKFKDLNLEQIEDPTPAPTPSGSEPTP